MQFQTVGLLRFSELNGIIFNQHRYKNKHLRIVIHSHPGCIKCLCTQAIKPLIAGGGRIAEKFKKYSDRRFS